VSYREIIYTPTSSLPSYNYATLS